MTVKKSLLWVLLVLVALVAGCAAPTEATEDAPARSIVVSGYGTEAGVPDVAYVTLGVDTLDTDVAAAFADAMARMNAVYAVMGAAGVASEDMLTVRYNIWQEQVYREPMMSEGTVPAEERLYHVENVLRVTVRDVATVGELLTEAFDAGVNRVDGISFAIEDTSSLTEAARSEALADARARAEQIASEMQVELGELRSVQESGAMPYMPEMTGIGGGGGMPVSAGEYEISVQVNVVYSIGQ